MTLLRPAVMRQVGGRGAGARRRAARPEGGSDDGRAHRHGGTDIVTFLRMWLVPATSRRRHTTCFATPPHGGLVPWVGNGHIADGWNQSRVRTLRAGPQAIKGERH
jgi:hypothetical protein